MLVVRSFAGAKSDVRDFGSRHAAFEEARRDGGVSADGTDKDHLATPVSPLRNQYDARQDRAGRAGTRQADIRMSKMRSRRIGRR